MPPVRRLTAILAADVAGYSRLMWADEEGTLARLKAIRRELGDPKIKEHRGRIVKTTGDGLLVEFPSVVDAVRCAVEPTRSQNMTVSCLRSAVSARGGDDGAGRAGAAASPMAFPQPPQNLAVGSFSKPQAGQGDGSGAPHWAQKRLPIAFSAMQLGQRTYAPGANRPIARITGGCGV